MTTHRALAASDTRNATAEVGQNMDTPIQTPTDTQGHLVFVLAAFAVAVATFLIVLVMISASNA